MITLCKLCLFSFFCRYPLFCDLFANFALFCFVSLKYSLLTTLQSLCPGSCGLKYKSLESGAMRGLRLIDGKLQAPEEGFAAIDVFYCVFSKGLLLIYLSTFAN